MSLTINQTPSAATSSAASGASSSTAASSSSSSLATEQTFLQLLVAQLANQDPLQPTQGTDFVTQLAQFAQVEQSENQTSALQSMSSQLTGLSNNDTTVLVGKTVTIQGSAVAYDGTNPAPFSYTLASNATGGTVTISDWRTVGV